MSPGREDKHIDENQKDNDSIDKPLYYVGIGASAGGLEALESFFKHIPDENGLAFIVIQHLSPDFKSMMDALLARHTKMKIQKAEEGMAIKANSVYLIPPKTDLTIFHGKLYLNEHIDHKNRLNLPIDVFFHSLAEDQMEKSIGIICSGTGTDGTRGIRAIKEAGGLIMIQDEESAKFDGMPKSAISTGLADFVAPPEEMASQLMSIIKHPLAAQQIASGTILSNQDGLEKIFSILRDKFKLDFTFYKPTTVIRRIERRMTINQIYDLKDYIDHLLDFPREAKTLYEELLIGVTNFFRDPEAFSLLENNYLPEIMKKADGEVRLWVPGCSTGEEAYSLAILCNECLERLEIKRSLKIFATDVDTNAIVTAGAGKYRESVAADIPDKFLSKYFSFSEGVYTINRQIREMVVFAHHNIIKDPPFTHISLVSCRNLLIYLQQVLQRRVLEYFNFSLVPSGILLLGSSETTGEMAEYFDTLSTRWKIYRSKGHRKINLRGPLLHADRKNLGRSHPGLTVLRKQNRFQEEERTLDRLLKGLTEDILPTILVVNSHMELVYTVGEFDDYFKIPSGKMTNDVTKMTIKELSIPLSTGLQKVFTKSEEVKFSTIRIKTKDEVISLGVRILPLPESKDHISLAAILIKKEIPASEEESQKDIADYDIGKEAEQRIKDLEQELQFNRENLQATVEELETSNEELQASNEELLASNEELQSTNEELQSVNEELYTVNAEFQRKIMELTQLNNDMDNLLNSTEIGTLFLDENLEIRKFTRGIKGIFKFKEQDVGRPFSHITNELTNIDLLSQIKKVMRSNKPIESRVRTKDDFWYLMRIMPYKINEDVFSGVVLAFIDISNLMKVEDELSAVEDRYSLLFEILDTGVVYQDATGKILTCNETAEKILGLSKDKITGKFSVDSQWRAIHEDGSEFPGEEHPAMIALKTGKRVNDVIMGVFNAVEKYYRWIQINSTPQFDNDLSKPIGVFTTFADITRRVDREKELQVKSNFFDLLYKDMFHAKLILQVDEKAADKQNRFSILSGNPALEKMFEVSVEEIEGKALSSVFPNLISSRKQLHQKIQDIYKSGEPGVFTASDAETGKKFKISVYSPDSEHLVLIIQGVGK